MGSLFGNIGKWFGGQSLGDWGTLLGGVGSVVAAFNQPEAPEAPEVPNVPTPSVEPMKDMVADGLNDRRKRARQSSRAKKRVSQLSDQDIKATSLVG